MKKTKIICTIGPTSDDREVMKQLILNGMDVARFNFSHGSHEEHKKRLEQLRELSEETGVPVAALLDTKGPEIRTCTLKGGNKVTLTAGQSFVLTTEAVEGDELWKKLWDNRNYFAEKLEKLGLNTGSSVTPVIPIIVGDAEKA